MQPVARATSISLKNILVATDFSPASEPAVLRASSLARHYGSDLFLAHVVRPEMQSTVDQAWREAQRVSTDLLVAGHLRGIPHKVVVERGEIWEGLSRIIRQHDIDLVVIGTHGRSGISKMLLSSVAERIFRQASCPVMTVGPNAPADTAPEPVLHRILYATDFTPHSLHASAHAVSLAEHYKAKLILVHVLEPVGNAGAKGEAVEDGKRQLRQIAPATVAPPPEFVVEFGTPASRILAIAADKNPDLIVLGVRQPLSLAGRMWATASEVVAKARCPVLTVRAPQSAP